MEAILFEKGRIINYFNMRSFKFPYIKKNQCNYNVKKNGKGKEVYYV